MTQPIQDQLNRPLHDLRISVTDRCNFRCGYCMPKEAFGRDHHFLKRAALLSFEEIERIARIFVGFGVRKIRLTGGEPLLRQNLDTLIEKLASIELLEDLSLTTNASLLTKKRALALRRAGINRVNVSLDALDNPTFMAINDVTFPVEKVLEGIDCLVSAGFEDIKVNMVVQKGLNEHAIMPMVAHFRSQYQPGQCTLRFIEFMDVGNQNEWQLEDVISAKQIHEQIHSLHPLKAMPANYLGEVAQRWQYQDGMGEVGIISSITQPFCHDCSRARLSAVGEIYTCLFASKGVPLLDSLRGGISDTGLQKRIQSAWQQRDDQYSVYRLSPKGSQHKKVEMSYIGG